MAESVEVVDLAKTAEEAATKSVSKMNDKVAEAVQTSWTLDIFGVPLWEVAIIFLISALVYNIFLHRFFCNLYTKKRRKFVSKYHAIVYYVTVGVMLSLVSYLIARYSAFQVETLVSVLMMFVMWTIAKYLQKFLDKYFVVWSQKRFGKRAVTHTGVKSLIKIVILMIALVFTFIVLRIGMMNFLNIPIPKYFVAFVIVPFLFKVNALSYFSVIGTGFIIGDFIQVGLDSDAVSGTCIRVSLSGVILEMRNGERISLPLSYVAKSVVINKSTMRSYPSDRTYYLQVGLNKAKMRVCEQSVRKIISKRKECKLIQCVYIGVQYRHELRVVFDVEANKLSDAQQIMNDVHADIADSCNEYFATANIIDK